MMHIHLSPTLSGVRLMSRKRPASTPLGRPQSGLVAAGIQISWLLKGRTVGPLRVVEKGFEPGPSRWMPLVSLVDADEARRRGAASAGSNIRRSSGGIPITLSTTSELMMVAVFPPGAGLHHECMMPGLRVPKLKAL